MTSFTLEQLRILNETITSAPEVEHGRIEAANLILALRGHDITIKRHEDALTVLRQLEQELLDTGQYEYALTLLLDRAIFDCGPESVIRIMESMRKHHKLLVQGAAGTGKTYTCVAWLYADWRRWPEGTSIKMASHYEDHLRTNVFAHLVRFHRAAQEVIPMEKDVVVKDLRLGLKDGGEEMGFSGVAFAKGDRGTGHFKGFHPVAVKKPHPKLGKYSRLRVCGDEGQNWSNGPFEDFGSYLASINEAGNVKAVICYNPEETTDKVVELADPVGGWTMEDMETLYDWESNLGWRVCRLDAARLENVVQRKEIYPNFQSYEGYIGIIREAGDNGEKFYWGCRGWPPLKGSVNSVIPSAWINECRGTANFLPGAEYLMSTDMAYAGIDKPTAAVWTFGKAAGWWRQNGEYVIFRDRLSRKETPRYVIQLDQIIYLQKCSLTGQAADEIMGLCNQLKIPPENVAIDCTGAGVGTASELIQRWGEILPVNWGEGATDMKVMAEDIKPASGLYEGIISEMWFTVRRWMDPTVNALLINPIVPMHPLGTQLNTRRFEYGKERRQRVEKKDQWKARHKTSSPDEADSMIMGPFLVRMRKGFLPGLKEEIGEGTGADKNSDHSFQKLESVDIDDQLDGVGGGEQQLAES